MSPLRRPLRFVRLEDRIVPAPVIASVSNNGPANEGASVTVIAIAQNSAGGLFYEFDFNNDGTFDTTSVTGVVRHFFGESGNHTVSVRATDVTGVSAVASTVVTVRNVAPTLSNVSLTPAVTEGGTATLTGTIFDPGADSFTLNINWGDGSPAQAVSLAVGTASFSVQHTYQDNPTGVPVGPFTVSATLVDDDGGIAPSVSRIGAPNAFGYAAYTESSTGARLNLGDAGVFVVSDNDADKSVFIDLGSNSFRFYGTSYSGSNALFVSTNGFITFNGTGFTTTNLNSSPFPAAIAPLAEDWVTYRTAADMILARFEDVTGDGKPDQLVVQWTDIQYVLGSPPATFQAVLALNTGTTPGDVVFNYLRLDPSEGHSSGALGAVGIKNANSPAADAISIKTANGVTHPAVVEGGSIRFTTASVPSVTRNVSVANVAPTITALTPSAGTIGRGDTLVLTGVVADPGSLDTGTVSIDWGDGSTELVSVNPLTHSFSASHQYLANPSGTATDTFMVRVTAADNDGGVGAAAEMAVNVVTLPPTIGSLVAASIFEGDSAVLTGTIADNGTNDRFTVSIDWNGDGEDDETFADVAAGSFAYSHLYTDDVADGVSVRVTVTNLGGSTEASTLIVILNAAPVLTLDTIATVVEGGTTTLAGTIADAGVADTITLTVNWGDGSDPQTYSLGTDRQFVLQHQYLNDPTGGAYAVTVTAVDNGGDSGTAAADAAVTNDAPANITLNSGDVTEGGTFTLSGSFSDPGSLDSHTVVINWGDGTSPTTVTLAAGEQTFTASHQYLDDLPDGPAAIGVVVTDDGGAASTAGTTVGIANATPTAAPLTGSSAGLTGQTLTYSSSAGDVGTLDTLTADWDFGDGTTLTTPVDPAVGVTATHNYAAAGVYTVRLTIRDDDGGEVVVTTTVTITTPTSPPANASATLGPDPLGGTALVVRGTAGNDVISITPDGHHVLKVTVNGAFLGTFAPTNRIVVYGLAGNDAIDVAGGIRLPAWLFGCDGNDTLKGGGGNDVVVGGAGNDSISGGQGCDLLIGGDGADVLGGNAGCELLISGRTFDDMDESRLAQIQAIWISNASYRCRVRSLRLGLLALSSMHDDGSLDVLNGSSDLAWYLAGANDVITGRSSNEVVDLIPV